jgi:hypothetical protein
MDPVTVTAAVMAFLAPYAVKAGEELAKHVASDSWGEAKTLFSRLKSRWAGDGRAVAYVEEYEKDPDTYSTELEKLLKTKLREDDEFLGDLESWLKSHGPLAMVIQSNEGVNEATGIEAKRFKSGDASVDQTNKNVGRAVGMKLEDLGK